MRALRLVGLAVLVYLLCLGTLAYVLGTTARTLLASPTGQQLQHKWERWLES